MERLKYAPNTTHRMKQSKVLVNYTRRDDGETQKILGFYRRKNETIETIVSDSSKLRSERQAKVKGMGCLGFFAGSWNPHREAQVVPLRVEKPKIKSVSRSQDYQALPHVIKEVFDAGLILRTSTRRESDFSALMYVTGGSKPEGRTGALLYKGQPIIIISNGKEFIVEIKGIGVGNGNNSITDSQTRSSYVDQGEERWGGFDVDEARIEFRNLEILRNERSKTFDDADSPRAVLLIMYDGRLKYYGNNTDQGYLLRLSPASVRASFNGNNALPEVFENKHNAIARGLAQQFVEMMTLDSLLIHISAHPENLVLTNDGYKFTDFSDMRTLAELADPHEIVRRTFTEYINEITGRTKRDVEEYCRIIAAGLGIKYKDKFRNTKALAEEIWRSYVAPSIFEIRKKGHNASREEVFKKIEEILESASFFPLDGVDDKILARARVGLKNCERNYTENKREIEFYRQHLDNPRQLASFKPCIVPGVLPALVYLEEHLERERDLLITIDGDRAHRIRQNADLKIREIRRLENDTYEVIDGLREDADYLIKLATLPYENSNDFNS